MRRFILRSLRGLGRESNLMSCSAILTTMSKADFLISVLKKNQKKAEARDRKNKGRDIKEEKAKG